MKKINKPVKGKGNMYSEGANIMMTIFSIAFIVFAVLYLSALYRYSQLKRELKNKEEEFYGLKFNSHRDVLMQKAEYEGIITRKDENKKLITAYRNVFDNICRNFILQDNHSMTRYLVYGDNAGFELDMLQKKRKKYWKP
jgi:hypothetical protein